MGTVYAVLAFKHDPLWLDVKAGDPIPADHEMVLLRPDLFTDTPPEAAKARKPKEA